MSRPTHTLRESVRIIWAIAAKDVKDAIKNKGILTMIFGLLMTMLLSQALPIAMRVSSITYLILYDEGESALVDALEDSDTFYLRQVSSYQEMELFIGEGGENQLGLVLPASFDETLEASNSVELEGYVLHSTSNREETELLGFFQGQLADLTGKPVHINTDNHIIYPLPDSDGHPHMVSLSNTLLLLLMSIILVPYLMIEEKETKTLNVLLVSPASYTEVVLGKALTGLIYNSIVAAIVFAVNYAMIVHWGLAILAAVCGTLFAVSLGLLLGVLFENPQQMNLWIGGVFIILMMPMLLSFAMQSSWPAVIRFLLPRVPSSALMQVLQASLAGNVPLGPVLGNLAILIGSAVLILALVVWRVRRMDR